MTNRWDIIKEFGKGPSPESVVSPHDGAEMVLVPGGAFTMGTTKEDLQKIFLADQRENPVFATEMPARQVEVGSFYCDRYPVTNFQYAKFIQETGHRRSLLLNEPGWNSPMQPVVFVGWDDARAYAAWAGKSLPTEAQWEKAGRGTDGRWWAWGNEFLTEKCNSREFELMHTSEIGLFDLGMSPYGCYDMCGNVWEMCEGVWRVEVDHQRQVESLPMRGGCFLGSASFVRVTCRWTPEDTDGGAEWLGFRCVKEIPD